MTEIASKIRVLIVCLCGAFGLLAGQALAQEADCGGYGRPIILAGLDWDSVQVHNAIASHILEEGFGCGTGSIPGSTVPMQQGVVRGDIDVAMEVWTDNLPEFMPAAFESGQVIDLGINFADANQGWFVPRYVIEGDPERGIEAVAPDLRSVSDLERYADLFRDPEQPEKGRFYNCIIGWVCEEINTEKLEAYGLSKEFSNFRPGTGVALATSMESAYLRGEPWFGYYWGPTWVLGKLDMYQLEEPEYSDLDEALRLGDRVAILKAGRVVQVGTPEEILTNPADDYVEAFVRNVDRGRVLTSRLAMEPALSVPADTTPTSLLPRVSEDEWQTAYVVDSRGRYLGVVGIDGVRQGARRGDGDLRKLLSETAPTVRQETPLVDVFSVSAASRVPIAVLGDDDSLEGVLTHRAVLSALTVDDDRVAAAEASPAAAGARG
jgi:ABC-type proline/glycine betaine transport system substrate-binding protein